MLHDPDAFAAITRKMKEPSPSSDTGGAPTVDELLRRIEIALATGEDGQTESTAKPAV